MVDLRTLYNSALFHVGQHIRTGHVLRVVRGLLAAGDGAPRILDAGSGGGGISFALAGAFPGATVDGLELAPDKVRATGERARRGGVGNLSFATGDVTRIGRPSAYDLVVSVDVFEHVGDDRAAMRSVHEALVPGGLFVLHVPRQRPRRFLARFEAHHQDDHVRDGYDPEQLRERLVAAGFQVREIRRTFGAAGELAWEMMQLGLGRRRRAGDLLRIALWPLIRLLAAVDVRLGGGRHGNGILVIAERPCEAASGDRVACL